ncbi:MAG TPA: hypothetical protein VGM23_13680, partial [Armatimonadota bacterium]
KKPTLKEDTTMKNMRTALLALGLLASTVGFAFADTDRANGKLDWVKLNAQPALQMQGTILQMLPQRQGNQRTMVSFQIANGKERLTIVLNPAGLQAGLAIRIGQRVYLNGWIITGRNGNRFFVARDMRYDNWDFDNNNGHGQPGWNNRPNGIPDNHNDRPDRPNGFEDNHNGQPDRPNGNQNNHNGQPDRPNGTQANHNGQPDRPNVNQDNHNGQPNQPNGTQANHNGQPSQPNGTQANHNGQPNQPNGTQANHNGQPNQPNTQPDSHTGQPANHNGTQDAHSGNQGKRN